MDSGSARDPRAEARSAGPTRGSPASRRCPQPLTLASCPWGVSFILSFLRIGSGIPVTFIARASCTDARIVVMMRGRITAQQYKYETNAQSGLSRVSGLWAAHTRPAS
jgi:hypothetical protein